MTSHHHHPNYPKYIILDKILGVHWFLNRNPRTKIWLSRKRLFDLRTIRGLPKRIIIQEPNDMQIRGPRIHEPSGPDTDQSCCRTWSCPRVLDFPVLVRGSQPQLRYLLGLCSYLDKNCKILNILEFDKSEWDWFSKSIWLQF